MEYQVILSYIYIDIIVYYSDMIEYWKRQNAMFFRLPACLCVWLGQLS